MRTLLIAFVQLYRWFVSPMLGQNCRFHPSCSCYAQEALARHGARGTGPCRGSTRESRWRESA